MEEAFIDVIYFEQSSTEITNQNLKGQEAETDNWQTDEVQIVWHISTNILLFTPFICSHKLWYVYVHLCSIIYSIGWILSINSQITSQIMMKYQIIPWLWYWGQYTEARPSQSYVLFALSFKGSTSGTIAGAKGPNW